MSDSKHIMMAIGLFLAVIVLGGMTLVLPNAREVRDLRDRAEDLRLRSEGVEQTTYMVEQLSQMMSDARTTIDSELKEIPSESGVAALIRRLSLPIDGVAVLDQTFSVGSTIEPLPETHPTIRAVPVTMTMQGTFESIYAVLRSIESMDRMVRLRSIRIQTAEERLNRRGQPIVETVLVVEAVYAEDR